jgi:hypothetical protein
MKTRTKPFIALVLLPFIFVLAPLPSLAQNQSKADQDKKPDDLIICRVFVVVLEVTVRDRKNKDVADLGHEDFRIYEDGKKRMIGSFQRQGISVNGQAVTLYKIGFYPIKENLDNKLRKIKIQVQTKSKMKYRVQSFK